MEFISSGPNEEPLQNGLVEASTQRRQQLDSSTPACKAEREGALREKVEEMKRDLLFLRSLLVRQERTYREDLKQQENTVVELKRSLQERQQQDKLKREELAKMKIENNTSHWRWGSEGEGRRLPPESTTHSDLRLVMNEYLQLIDYVTTWKEEEQNNFQEHKEHLLEAMQEVKEHLENTQKAHADLEMKDRRVGVAVRAQREAVAGLLGQLGRVERQVEELRGRFGATKRDAEATCARANEQLATMTRNHQLEVSKLTALTKKSELKISSLQETLERKTKENTAFIKMCDDLIHNQAKDDSSTVDSSHLDGDIE